MSDVPGAGNLPASTASPGPTARFGVFELDLRSGELRRDGIRVPLQEQPFRLLALLIERPGEVVTREDLRERLWPAEFVDFDHGLNTAVRKLRSALDDSADNPRFVETLARRGYRFIAPVSWNGAAVATAQTSSRRAAPWVVLALVVLIATTALLVLRRGRVPDSPMLWAVAVIPFTIDHAETEHVGDGLTEGLIDELSRLRSMRVMARTTVFRYKGSTPDPQRVGKDLDVGAVVMGDVRREAGAYRIRVELVDVRDGTQLWGNIFHAAPAELPMVQRRIAGDLTQRLRHDHGAVGQTTRNAEAYELYLRGLYAWNQRGHSEVRKAEVRKAIDYFTRAAALDPTYAAPHAGLANAWGVMVGNGAISPEEGAPRVIASARKALELDPRNAEAYTSLATTKFRNLWDFAGADEDYRRALELNPNYATAHQWYADYLRSMGRTGEARREIDIAYKLDPLSTSITATKCWNLVLDRRYRDAIAFSKKVAEVDPRFASPFCVTRAYAALGEFENAFAVMGEAPEFSDDLEVLSAAYRQSGREGLLRKRLELLMARQKAEYNFPVEIAETHALLGNSDEVFRWLDIAYRHRVSRLTGFHVNPQFDSVRDDPRFREILRRIGLPQSAFSPVPAGEKARS